MLLVGNGRLITHNKDLPFIQDGCVVIDKGFIVDFGSTETMKAQYSGDFFDVQGRVIAPGFINTHAHFYSAMARGMPPITNAQSKTFTDVLNNFWWPIDAALTKEEVHYSALIAGIECIKNGVTTVFDHHAGYGYIGGSLQTIAEAISPLGLRASLCFEASERAGEKALQAAIDENLDFLKNAASFGKFSALFGLHAPFTLSDSALEKCAKAALTLSSEPNFHVHVAEGPEDVKDAKAKGYKGAVDRLNAFGMLGEKTIAVHCIHTTEEELDILQNTNTAVIHNPQSNMGNAVGCAKIPEMMQKGILVGLGTDGYTQDVLMSLKTANILHKHRLENPSVMWAEPPTMLLENNRKITERHFGETVGIIAKGAAADIITLNYEPPTELNGDNFAGHLHFGIEGSDVWDVFAGGKQIMKNRIITVFDEKDELARARQSASGLWKRICLSS